MKKKCFSCGKIKPRCRARMLKSEMMGMLSDDRVTLALRDGGGLKKSTVQRRLGDKLCTFDWRAEMSGVCRAGREL